MIISKSNCSLAMKYDEHSHNEAKDFTSTGPLLSIVFVTIQAVAH